MKKSRWDWLPEHMPGVAAKIAEYRQRYGVEHVAACWKAGVVEGKPGFFWAAEGSLAVGRPVDMKMVEAHVLAQSVSQTTVTVCIKLPEVL